ncbi:MAG TPA: glycosyltransferase [Chitinophagales bacterium]|nr:glycosyltransferase [Chitinophagales bacterium]
MPINSLYISYDGMTDPLGQSQVIPYLIGLTKNGYHISLISCEKAENFALYQSKIATLLSENNIQWHPISYTKKPPILSTLYDVFRIKKLATQLHHKHHFSIIHCRSYIAALVGLQLKKKLGLKFIFDMRGFWANERVDGNIWHLNNPIYKLVFNYFKKKEIEFLENADYTISLTHNAKEEILSWKNIKNNPIKIEVIPCCVDLQLFNKTQIQQEKLYTLQNELQIRQGDYVLLYLGSIGTWYMLDEMMEFFSVLKQKKEHAKFLFVTKEEHVRIKQTAAKYRVEDAIIIRPGIREEIPYLIALCQLSIFFILPSYSKKASSPTKQGELMAMGIPIVCNTNVGDTDKVVIDFKSGILVNAFTQAEYINAIEQIDNKFDTAQIIKGAHDYFSLEKGVEKYVSVYKNITQ